MALFTKNFKSALASVVSASLVVTSVVPRAVSAQTVTCNAALADAGQAPACGAVRIGSVPVSFPKLQWEKVTDDLAVAASTGMAQKVDLAISKESVSRAASVLGLSASQVANSANVFPSNVPYLMAKYNPMEGTLRIDLFKLEKTLGAGGARVGLYHAVFGPGQGDVYKANRSYLSPTAYSGGTAPGVNPFASFSSSAKGLAPDDLFHNISLSGAQVAMGHAMRLVGAPTGVMAVLEGRLSSTTTTSKSFWSKKTTTTVYGHAKPRWLVAQPTEVLNRASSQSNASFCAANPASASCPLYQTAMAGVAFEEFAGGPLDSAEDTWMIDQQSKRGLTFLGALVLIVVASVAASSLLAATGALSGSSLGATLTSGSSAVGSMSSLLVNQGLITGASSLTGALAVETTLQAASMALIGGANLGSTLQTSPGLLLGMINVSQGALAPAAMSGYQANLNAKLAEQVGSSPAQPAAGATAPTQRTVGLVAVLANQPSGVNQTVLNVGLLPSLNGYTEVKAVSFLKDNSGTLVRSD